MFKCLRRVEMLLSGLIPFLIGYASKHECIAIIIGLLGVAITYISGVLSLCKFQENWVDYRSVCENLKHEKFMYLTSTGPYKTENPFQLLVERIETIITHENLHWEQLYTDTDKHGLPNHKVTSSS